MNRAHVLICFCTISFTHRRRSENKRIQAELPEGHSADSVGQLLCLHGPAAQESDLRLDQRESALRVLFGKGQDPQKQQHLTSNSRPSCSGYPRPMPTW